jgi:hypothetical protein
MKMPDIHSATRYIAVASTSDFIDTERREDTPPVYQDYALMKVLTMLGLNAKNISGVPTQIAPPRIPVHSFECTGQATVTPLDFSGLQDSDVIFIAGHGNPEGLYAMGSDLSKKGMERLIKILTQDGNLKLKRENKKTIIVLLSCRAGLGFHKSLARRLSKALNIDITVGGALGFTFGSMQTFCLALNEVLPIGLPWFMEYPTSLSLAEAEAHTSAREGKDITFARKENEIKAFKDKAKDLEKEMNAVINQLTSKEVNQAIAELDSKFRSKWLALIRSQFELYERSKTQSNLEFDMWYNFITEGYVWTNGQLVTDQQADSLLTGDLDPGHPERGLTK